MHYAISSIKCLHHVLLVLCVVNNTLCSYDEEIVIQISGQRIIPEHGELTLECEIISDDPQSSSMSWFYSENMTPINKNRYQSTNGKSTLKIQNVLRQQASLYYCCLDDSTTICATHSVVVLYTTFNRHIMPINETSGVLVLTKFTDAVAEQARYSFDFALCLRYRWEFENVDIVSSSGTEMQHNDTIEKRSDRTLFWKHLYYNIQYNLRTGNRLFEVQYTNNVSEVKYYLHVFLNGKPKPKMSDIIILPDTGFIDLSCWGTAIPAPKVTFSFTPCPSLEWNNCNNSPVTLEEITPTGSSTISFNESVQVIGSSLSSGIVQCKATNSEGTSVTHAKLFQLHQQEAIRLIILHPSTTIYVGDSITVHCFADRYNFTNKFTFHVNDKQVEVLGLQDNFNWVANFTIHNVTISDNPIVCESLHQNGILIGKTLALNIVQPYIDAQHMVRHVVAKPDTQLLLTCEVSGRPTPQYRWVKNDIELPNANYMMVASISGDDKFECIAWNRAGMVTITWMISNTSSSSSGSNIASLEFYVQCLLVIVLLVIVIIGAILCYFRTKELCILIRLYKSIRTR